VSTGDADEDSTTLVFSSPSSNDLGRLPTVLTTREAATVLRIGVKEVRQLVEAGDIPAARFGPRRVIRIARSALERILRGHARRRT
jgi:excisionase family DNA binding protein